jgi:hypothetical protein
MWSRKREINKRSIAEAERNHPEGFKTVGEMKAAAIKAKETLFGGFAQNPFKEVVTLDDVANQRNAMALIDGNYPLSMTDCEVVGISGYCGLGCPVLLDGRCEDEAEIKAREDR